MITRYAGATLGLLAFAVAVTAGLSVGNPPTVILSRAVLALFLFCILGLLLGTAAQYVISEYEDKREHEIRKRYEEMTAAPTDGGADQTSAGNNAEPSGA